MRDLWESVLRPGGLFLAWFFTVAWIVGDMDPDKAGAVVIGITVATLYVIHLVNKGKGE